MNKELCQRCHGKLDVEWKRSDDDRWKRGLVGCPARGWAPTRLEAGKNEVPPSCPFYFEQVVLGQSSFEEEVS